MATASPPALPPDAFGDKSYRIYASCIPVTVLASIAVLLRFFSRRRAKTFLWWDDWMAVIALIFYFGLVAIALASAAKWGLGRHVYINDPEKQLVPLFKALVAYQILYACTQTPIKLSLILLYFRLFKPSHRFRVSCYCVSAVVIAWFLAFFLASCFNCVPLSFFWDRNIPGGGTCLDAVKLTYGNGISNLLLDILVLCLPFPMIFTLHMSKKIKLTLTAIFLLGFFVCATSVIRISQVKALVSDDPTWNGMGIYEWSSVECACGIICACLPTMRPLLPGFLARSVNATAASRQRTYGNSSSKWDTRGHDSSSAGNGFSRLDTDGLDEEERPIALTDVKHVGDGRGVITTIEASAPRTNSMEYNVNHGPGMGGPEGGIFVHSTIEQGEGR